MNLFNIWILLGFFGAILLVKVSQRWADSFDDLKYAYDPLGIVFVSFCSVLLGPVSLFFGMKVELDFYIKFKGNLELEYKYMIKHEED